MSNFVPVNEPLLDGNEASYLQQCIDTGWISSEGPFVDRFERGVADRLGRTHAIAVANGSVALDLAVEALDLQAGDEVIVPTFTIISCVAPLVRRSLKPVLVDCDPYVYTMEVDGLDARITEKTRAIMAVHLYGLPVDMDSVLAIARTHGLAVIEDSAEAIGLVYRDRPCGSMGTISTLSFYPNKHITTGEGGMVLTDDEGLARRGRSLRNLCFGTQRRFVHEDLGFNYRMSNLQAAVGCAQLERLDTHLEKKQAIGAFYNRALKPYETLLQLPRIETEYARNGYWVYPVVLRDEVPFDAQAFATRLAETGIGTRPFFYPMHRQPVFLKQGLFKDISLPHAERLAERGLYLPSGLALTPDQQTRVVQAVGDILDELL